MRLFANSKSISIDIGPRDIKIVEGKANKKNIVINNTGLVDLPQDIYSDGTILDIHQLSDYLRNGLKDNKISSNKARLVVNSSNIITREIVLPKVSDDEIKSILRYQIGDYVPIVAEDYIFQHIHLGSVFEEGVERLNLLLIAIPKAIVESHFALMHNVGLKAEVMDFQGNAISKLLNYNDLVNEHRPSKDNTIASIAMDFDNTKINIILNGLIKVSRVINIGAGDFIKAIQEEIDMDENAILEKLKDLDLDNGANDLEGEESTFFNLLNSNLDAMFESIDMVRQYHNTREVGNNIDYILLQGVFSKMKGLENRFSNYFNINTIKLSSLDRIKSDVDMGIYSNAIGGLIRLDEV